MCPSRVGQPATAAVVSGEVDFAFTNMTDALPQMEANTVRGLAVTSTERSRSCRSCRHRRGDVARLQRGILERDHGSSRHA